jgi:hypothetical protein
VRTFFLILLLSGPLLCLSQRVSCDIKYEQFGTEILIYAEISNRSEETLTGEIELSVSNIDFSGLLLSSNRNMSFTAKPKELSSVVLTSVEYSVLESTDVRIEYREVGGEAYLDSLNLSFPNKFKNVSANGQPSDIEIDLGGLKIDRTRTPYGRKLFEKFETIWNSPSGIVDYSIEFEELPFRFRSSLLKVYLNNELIFESYIQDQEELLSNIVLFLQATITQKLIAEYNDTEDFLKTTSGI